MSDIFSSPFLYAVLVTLAAFAAAYGSQRINRIRNKILTQTEEALSTATTTLSELEKAGENIDLSIQRTEEVNLTLIENLDET